MNELVRALKDFIVRDIIFIIGGSIVIVSFLYTFEKLPLLNKETPIAVFLFVAGIAYVIGYCIQDTASLIRLVTTASYFEPCAILQDLYRYLLHRDWKNIFSEIQDKDRRSKIFEKLDELELLIRENPSKVNDAFRERLTSLMMIGTTIGPCSLFSGLLLLYKAFGISFCNFYCFSKLYVANIPCWLDFCFFKESVFDVSLAFFILVLSGCLIILGWLKNMQLMHYNYTLYMHLKQKGDY